MSAVLGADLEEELTAVCTQNFMHHAATLPLAQNGCTEEEVEERPFDIATNHSPRAVHTIDASKNLSKLPDFVQDCFADILEKTEDVLTAQEGLSLLVNRLVPLLGFTRGCVFNLSKDGGRMLPVLRFGDLPLNRYDEYIFDKYQGMKSYIFQTAPFKRDGIGFAGEPVSYLIGGLDSSEYQGVLYFEKPLASDDDVDDQSLLYYRCLREVLTELFDSLLSGPS